MDNYDKLLLKPIMEQPDYIPEEYLRMQRSGVLRYTPSCIHFGPSYFKQLEELQTKMYAEFHPQMCHLEARTASDIGMIIQDLRTAKALPLTLVTPLKIAH